MAEIRQRAGKKFDAKTEEELFPQTNSEDKTKDESPSQPEEDDFSNLMLIVVTGLGLITRFWHISNPSEVVFDEVHFGKFASFYLKRTYFFDVHPPLAKLMLAAMGWFLGYDGHFEFDNIGDDYIKNNVPYVGLRLLPATLGGLLVPLTYLILIESGYPVITACFAAGLVLFDNALITQTRLILLDAMLVFFMTCTLYSYIKFYKFRLSPFSTDWWLWLTITGVLLGLTMSVKMVGLLTVATIGFAVLSDLWELLDIRRGLSMQQFRSHFFARAVCLIVIPIAIYLFWFYVHFAILNGSGPGDAFMSPEFQLTLKGNSLSYESHEIRFGDTISLKHKDTSVFLHSHPQKYPLRYDDGRISSQGQQVTGYPHRDSNNHWIVKPATPFLDSADRPLNDTIKHGDHIRLEHVNTHSHLLTHDVASPLMPTNQEFTTISVEDDSRYNETVFQVLIEKGESNTVWKSKASYTRLLHYSTKVALWTHKEALPQWAFKQQEVNGNKNNVEKSNLWYVDEIVGKNVTEVEKPKKPPKEMPFIYKFFELQRLMIAHNSGLTKSHPYASSPINWPFLVRGISFWTKNDSRSQIYLLGNPLTWWLSIGSISVFVGIFGAEVISRRRGMTPLHPPVRNRFYNSAGFFVMAWLLHYGPFFLMGRALFLHHYLPALLCSYLVAAVMFNFMFVNSLNYPVSYPPLTKKPVRQVLHADVPWTSYLVVGLLLGGIAVIFWFFAPITYGTPGLSIEEVKRMMWLDTWDLHFAVK
ncbi:7149_t:CDS:10 [Paraglomus occultum]|uniref:Dolichyl-phosphate-mannose--protein mannosyltransferase n=1 Tax=Paraglomus occultum TaxID=144539 RepID=A0A9N8ZL96_9GLOM|nr:7149_t:CDS:10 [Paraglomus occultum]